MDDEFKTKHGTAKREISGLQCKRGFIRNYGYKFDLAAFYTLEAKTFERDPSYIFRISRYVMSNA